MLELRHYSSSRWTRRLGDRHCENILLDTNTGDVVHVDFNCLFEKVLRLLCGRFNPFNSLSSIQGKTLEVPERVPFRLTQNVIDGLGVTGVEGVFRIACEITMQLLRDNKDSLMSVLDAFIHDPLVEWEDEKRKMVGVGEMTRDRGLTAYRTASDAMLSNRRRISDIWPRTRYDRSNEN